MAAERDRITKLKSELNSQIADLRSQIEDLDIELHAITAYEKAKSGKASSPSTGTRSPRGSKREALLAIIKNNPAITRGQLIEHMGIKGDKAHEGTLSNTLGLLKKAGLVKSDDGKYSLA